MKIFALSSDIIYSPRMITADPADVILLRDKLAELRWRRNVENPQRRAAMAMHRAHGRIARDVRSRKVVYLRGRS